jgi:hypothetical protein
MRSRYLILPISLFFLYVIAGAKTEHCPHSAQRSREFCQDRVLSLEKIAEKHRAAVSRQEGEVRAFEIAVRNLRPEVLRTGSLTPGVEIDSSFVSPRDDVWYFKVHESVNVGANNSPNHQLEVSKEGFVIKICNQGYILPEMKCQQPTGEPESRQKHLPIQNWRIRLSQVGDILLKNNYSLSDFNTLIITTVGRIKSQASKTSLPDESNNIIPRQLKNLSDDNPIISLSGRKNMKDSSIIFVVIDAKSGMILAKGSYQQSAPLFQP